MCQSKAEGGRRCECDRGAENARKRAGYAAAKAAALSESAALLEPVSGDLPETDPEPLVARQVTKAELAATMRDLRRSTVGDDAEQDAALRFAAEIARQRLAARARGASTDHKWSVHNRALVAAQAGKRGAEPIGWMGGERQWAAQGRVLRTGPGGEKPEPYKIWAPVVRPLGDDEEDAGGAPRTSPRSVVSFREVSVYDWTQTRAADGTPDPDWSVDIPGGDEELLARMKRLAPLPVIDDHTGTLTGNSHGWTDGESRVVLNTRGSVASQISTLAHEWGHVHLDHVARMQRGEITRDQAEAEVGLVQHLVFAHTGHPAEATDASATNAAAYLRHWVKEDGKPVAGHKQRWKILEARMAPALDAAMHILTALHGLGDDSAADDARAA